MSRALALCVLCGVSLAGCGGGGGGGSGAPRSLSSAGVVSYTPGVYQPSSGLADQCAAPRTGTAPNGRPYPDRQGSVAAENNFLRSWTNELYLWYDEAPDLNPSSYDDTLEYFDLLKTDEITPSGRYKDEFHFSLDTASPPFRHGASWSPMCSRAHPPRTPVWRAVMKCLPWTAQTR
jgi:hypothetical protein